MSAGRRTVLNFLKVLVVRGIGIVLSLGVSVLLANRLGASAPADAFFFVRNLVLELTEACRRVLLAWLVPVCVEAGPRGANRVIGRYLIAMTVLGGALGGLLALAAPLYAPLLAPGFDPDRIALTERLFALFAPLMPLILCISVLGAALNAVRRFGIAETAMIAPRVALLVALLVLAPDFGVMAFALSMLLGGVAGMAMVSGVWLRIGKAALALLPEPGTRPAAGPPTSLAAIILVQFYGQLTLWLDYSFITAFPVGAVATNDYAQRLILLLPGVVSASVVTILYTELSHSRESAAVPAARAGRLGLLVVAPMVALMALFARDLVEILFGHGRFTAEAVDATAAQMLRYAPVPLVGLFTNVVIVAMLLDRGLNRIRLLLPVYALSLPVRYGLLAAFTARYGLEGVPVAVMVSSALVLAVLVGVPRAYRHVFLGREMLRVLAQLGLATLALAATVEALLALAPPDAGAPVLLRVLLIAAYSACGLVAYLGTALFMQVEDLHRVAGLLIRKFR